jgi:hypothetical protein
MEEELAEYREMVERKMDQIDLHYIRNYLPQIILLLLLHIQLHLLHIHKIQMQELEEVKL